MYGGKLEARGGYSIYKNCFEIFMFSENPMSGKRFLAKAPEFEEIQNEIYQIKEATFELDQHGAQSLFNVLWQSGLRPKDGTGNGSHLDAINKHLQDMRYLAFKGNMPEDSKPKNNDY